MGLAIETAAGGFDDGDLEGDRVNVPLKSGDWVVAGTRKEGAVLLKGLDGLMARYCEMGAYDWDACSQEMAVHDARAERVFFDIRWAAREPAGDDLKAVVEGMQRAVQLAAAGR